MQTGILRALRASAVPWWRYKELRRAGQPELARRLERKAILRDLEYLRRAASLPNAHVICGKGGTFIHLGWDTVSTSAPIERFPLAALVVARGIPLIDIRSITDAIAFANLPWVTPYGPDDPAPCRSSAHVLLTTYLDLARQLGARIVNDPRTNRAA